MYVSFFKVPHFTFQSFYMLLVNKQPKFSNIIELPSFFFFFCNTSHFKSNLTRPCWWSLDHQHGVISNTATLCSNQHKVQSAERGANVHIAFFRIYW